MVKMIVGGCSLVLVGISSLCVPGCSDDAEPAGESLVDASSASEGGSPEGSAPVEDTSMSIDADGTGHLDALPINDAQSEACMIETIKMVFVDECGWSIPSTSIPARAENAVVTLVTAAGPQKLMRVADEAACKETTGWYYADPAVPRRVELCDDTCRAVQGMSDGSVASFAPGCP